MKLKVLNIIILIFVLTSCSVKQNHLNKSKSGVLCVACGISASPDKAFYELDILVGNKDYDGIIENLFDERPAVLYISILALEEIEKRNNFHFNDSVQKRIQYLKSSFHSILLGYGCEIVSEGETPLYFTDIFDRSPHIFLFNPLLYDVEDYVVRIVEREF